MFKFGLKLWSLNTYYVPEAVRLFEHGIYAYIELYVIPDSYHQMIDVWKPLNIPYVIHAPHSGHGMNLAKHAALEKNMKMAREVQCFADDLNADTIIFHPGMGGNIQETAFQLHQINDSRIVLENKPYFSLYDQSICTGHSPEELEYAINETGIGFCLDLGHAVCAANARGIDPFMLIQAFMRLHPVLYHLSDGDWNGVKDQHLHIGSGTFPVQRLVQNIPGQSHLTLETAKDNDARLEAFANDVEHIKTAAAYRII